MSVAREFFGTFTILAGDMEAFGAATDLVEVILEGIAGAGVKGFEKSCDPVLGDPNDGDKAGGENWPKGFVVGRGRFWVLEIPFDEDVNGLRKGFGAGTPTGDPTNLFSVPNVEAAKGEANGFGAAATEGKSPAILGSCGPGVVPLV